MTDNPSTKEVSQSVWSQWTGNFVGIYWMMIIESNNLLFHYLDQPSADLEALLACKRVCLKLDHLNINPVPSSASDGLRTAAISVVS
ncbi:hypothetical protein O181_062670 [Austropuccinia psidii MF-1]|uniref:Uncharacterized protein n=1 Tax=Austropuccinia psidii MF-1 TaxID=1389203 RepID=A0A9Q3I1J2_9BASI|nr:hypothetical protein [Austropuccinia psidii MF-1]